MPTNHDNEDDDFQIGGPYYALGEGPNPPPYSAMDDQQLSNTMVAPFDMSMYAPVDFDALLHETDPLRPGRAVGANPTDFESWACLGNSPSPPTFQQLVREVYGPPSGGTGVTMGMDGQAGYQRTARSSLQPALKNEAPASVGLRCQQVPTDPPVSTPPSVTKRKRNNEATSAPAAPAAPAPTNTNTSAGRNFNVFLQVEVAVPVIRGSRSKAKPAKATYTPRGSFSFNTSKSWQEFLNAIANALDVTTRCLKPHSFVWKWVKGSSGSGTVRNEGELAVLYDEILGSVVKDVAKPISVMMKAAKHAVEIGQEADEDLDSDIEEVVESSSAKKYKVNDELNETADKLIEKYRIGGCQLHPDLHCFHHMLTGKHFDIGYRPRALAWAGLILINKASFERLPKGCPLFKDNKALGVKEPSAQAPAMLSGYPNYGYGMYGMPYPSLGVGQPQLTGYVTPATIPPNLSPFLGGPNTSAVTAAPSVDPSSAGSGHPLSSPILGPATAMSLKEFCRMYGLDEGDDERLSGLGFRVGTSPETMDKTSEKVWKGAGFAHFAWARVIKACKKYCRDHPEMGRR